LLNAASRGIIMGMTTTVVLPELPTLPGLTGSLKQVGWADGIRDGLIEDAIEYARRKWSLEMTSEHYVSQLPAELGVQARRHDAAYSIFVVAIVAQAATLTEAAWWIDHRRDRSIADAVWCTLRGPQGLQARRDIEAQVVAARDAANLAAKAA
jgi:hypothetical protein